MSGTPVKAVLDTNILVDYLRGLEEARQELARHGGPAISLLTWMEVLVGARSQQEGTKLRAFLDRFHNLPIDRGVADEAVSLRRAHRIRLPDAIIWGTARVTDSLLVTRNTRDFPADDPGVRIPYRLS